MCRSIKPLFNLDPPATDAEIQAAARQFVRKVSGFPKPSKANETPFEDAVDAVAKTVAALFGTLGNSARPRSREELARQARERSERGRAGPVNPNNVGDKP